MLFEQLTAEQNVLDPPLRFSWPSVEHWEGLELQPVDTGSLIAKFQIVFRSSKNEQLSEGKPNTERSHVLFFMNLGPPFSITLRSRRVRS